MMAKAESARMIRKMAETTAEVVDVPTPSAPPFTLNPRWQPIPAISRAKTTALTRLVAKSKTRMLDFVCWI